MFIIKPFLASLQLLDNLLSQTSMEMPIHMLFQEDNISDSLCMGKHTVVILGLVPNILFASILIIKSMNFIHTQEHG